MNVLETLSKQKVTRADLNEALRQLSQNKIESFYPDKGPLSRKNYPKHLNFFKAKQRERLFLAANRVGKSEGVGGYEVALHLTGRYPPWWKGKRFNKPVDVWAAGQTNQTTRDILQKILLGPFNDLGTGLIPKDCIVRRPMSKMGIPEAVEIAYIKHVSGGTSVLGFKSYDQKRKSFEGTSKDVIWLDEEPALEIYTECLLRTMTTDGIVLLTFTPLLGLSSVVMAFLKDGRAPDEELTIGSKYVVTATWDDAPHLTKEMKDELWNSIPPYQRDARTKGIPQLGAGAIYPIEETDIIVKDIQIPDFWPRVYGMDVGWNRTACICAAWHRDNDIVYLTSEYYRGQAESSVHSHAIKSRGEWIPGVIDPASRGRGQSDGTQLLQSYMDLGLNLDTALNAVEAGIYEVWLRMSTGRLKVFSSCSNWIEEFRLYRRDEKGKIVKEKDHLMDATKYLILSGLENAIIKPVEEEPERQFAGGGGMGSWMG